MQRMCFTSSCNVYRARLPHSVKRQAMCSGLARDFTGNLYIFTHTGLCTRGWAGLGMSLSAYLACHTQHNGVLPDPSDPEKGHSLPTQPDSTQSVSNKSTPNTQLLDTRNNLFLEQTSFSRGSPGRRFQTILTSSTQLWAPGANVSWTHTKAPTCPPLQA